MGFSNSLIIRSKDNILVAGSNDHLQLGKAYFNNIEDNTEENITSGEDTNILSKLFTEEEYDNVPIKNILKTVSGKDFSFLIFKDELQSSPEFKDNINDDYHLINNVVAFGNNSKGQLGINNNVEGIGITTLSKFFDSKIKDISCGFYHTLFLSENGNVYVTGTGNKGQLGLGFSNKERTYPIKIEGLPRIKKISCGVSESYLIDINNRVWSCGSNVKGQLGLGNNTDKYTFTQVPDLYDISEISAGDGFVLALGFNGNVYATGYNKLYQLGLQDGLDRNKFTIIPNSEYISKIYTGIDYSILLTRDKLIKCAGNGAAHQLGDPEIESPVKKFTEISTINNVRDVYTMIESMVVLLNDGSIQGAGNNSYGELGIGSNSRNITFTKLPESNVHTFTFDDSKVDIIDGKYTEAKNYTV